MNWLDLLKETWREYNEDRAPRLYLARSNFTQAYGIIGSVMALLIYIYYGSQILFLGSELTSAYNRRLLQSAVAPASPLSSPNLGGSRNRCRKRCRLRVPSSWASSSVSFSPSVGSPLESVG